MKIMTANLWGLPWPLSKDKTTRLERFVEIVEKKSPDIICLQEVWLMKDLRYLREKLAKTGLTESFFAGGEVKNKKGLAIFSKIPIKSGEYHVFDGRSISFRGFFDKIRKGESSWPNGFSSILLEIGGKTFAVINAHLTFFDRSSDKNREKSVTKGEIRQLFDYINPLKLGVAGVFICGDFNMDVKDEDMILPKGLKVISDVSELTLTGEANPYANANDCMTCDLIIGPESANVIEKEIIKKPLVSDHYVVSSEIEV